jgi:ketosteroid isomerase-like protein
MKTIARKLLCVCFALIATISVYSQDWSKEQKEIWKLVEDEWAIWKNGDVEGLSALMHEKYQSWNNSMPLPVSKSMSVDFYKQMKDSFKVNYYSINPARITVTDNSAAVFYYYSMNYTFGEGESGKSKQMEGKYAEFYTKEGNKWLLLADFMLSDDEEDDD